MVAAASRTRRGRPSQSQATGKRERIVSSATALFLKDGFDAVSMRAVAERADVSTRTLYNVYPDKGALFAACLASVSATRAKATLAEDSALGPALEQFAADMVRLLCLPESLGFSRLVMRAGGSIPELAALGYASRREQFVLPLAAFLERNLADRAESETLATLFITMALSEWSSSVTFHRPLPDEQEIIAHARLCVRMFTSGVFARTSSGS